MAGSIGLGVTMPPTRSSAKGEKLKGNFLPPPSTANGNHTSVGFAGMNSITSARQTGYMPLEKFEKLTT
jgi:hypothetical protein